MDSIKTLSNKQLHEIAILLDQLSKSIMPYVTLQESQYKPLKKLFDEYKENNDAIFNHYTCYVDISNLVKNEAYTRFLAKKIL